MRRSKLEMHIDILRVLDSHGPLKLRHIAFKANINHRILKQCLDFLIERNVIEEQTLFKSKDKKRVVYAIAKRGLLVLEYFVELDNAFQIIVDRH